MPEEFYPSKPAPIFCWVCGTQLGRESWIRGHPPPFVFELKKWQLAWERHRHNRKYYRDMFGIHLATTELDREFRSKKTSDDLFRLILVSKDGRGCPKGYRVSGIAQLPGARRGGKYLLIPYHRDRACLGAPDNPPSDGIGEQGQASDRNAVVAAIPVPHPFSDLIQEEGYLDGYVVHSRCWTLMEKHIGAQAIERLDLVVPALGEQWDQLMECLQLPHGYFPDAYIAFLEFQDWKWRTLEDCDPLHIPEIKRIFQKSASSRTRQRKKSIANVPAKRLLAKHGIPAEIIYLIAEFLEVADARNMLIALGEHLPVHYWRKRIRDIFIEVEDADPGRIDWPCLAVMLDVKEDIFGPKSLNHPENGLSNRLWNRRRIIDMLRPIKQRVLQEMRL